MTKLSRERLDEIIDAVSIAVVTLKLSSDNSKMLTREIVKLDTAIIQAQRLIANDKDLLPESLKIELQTCIKGLEMLRSKARK